jgi:SAM-dependent methyltransferase
MKGSIPQVLNRAVEIRKPCRPRHLAEQAERLTAATTDNALDRRSPDMMNYPSDPMDRSEWESSVYDLFYASGRIDKPFFYHVAERNERAFVKSLIKKYQLAPGGSLLDVGCGNGRYASYFEREGLNVTAVDLSKEAIDYCSRSHNAKIRFICGNMFDLEYDQCFDYGFCNFFTFFNSFDVPSQGKLFVDKLMKVLRPKGKLIFVWISDLSAVRLAAGRFGIMNYTMKQLEEMFSGYSVASYAIDSCARLCAIMGRYSFSKCITRLCCCAIQIKSDSWHRVRIVLIVNK